MKKLGLMIGLLLILAASAAAQDWQEDEQKGTYYNCDLVRAMMADYGDHDLLQTGPDDFANLGNFLDTFFPKCLEKVTDAESGVDSDAESDEAIAVTTVVEVGEMIAFRDYCTLVIADDDVAEENRVYVSGGDHELISVDMYLPGATEALAIVDTAIEDLMGLPVRIETFGDAEFPVGRYTFDVRVEEDVHRFHWVRKDPENFGFMVSCVGEDGPVILPQIREMMLEESAEAAAAGEPVTATTATGEVEVDAVLESDSMHMLDADCFVLITDRFEADFNVTVSGSGLDEMSVDVYLPGESEPVAVRGVDEDVMDTGIPLRIEWLEGDQFPLGVYTIEMRIGEAGYRFQWDRQDELDYTIVLGCTRVQDFEEESGRLQDGDLHQFQDVACRLWTDTFDEDMNVVVAASDPKAIEVDLYFPDDSHPKEMDDVDRGAFEDGTKYRAEWIAGDSFPLGEYAIVLHIDGSSYRVVWEREDDAYNLVFVHCEGIDEAAES